MVEHASEERKIGDQLPVASSMDVVKLAAREWGIDNIELVGEERHVIDGTARTDADRELLGRELRAMAREDFSPGLVFGPFRVDDQAVKVKDQSCQCHRRSQPQARQRRVRRGTAPCVSELRAGWTARKSAWGGDFLVRVGVGAVVG